MWQISKSLPIPSTLKLNISTQTTGKKACSSSDTTALAHRPSTKLSSPKSTIASRSESSTPTTQSSSPAPKPTNNPPTDPANSHLALIQHLHGSSPLSSSASSWARPSTPKSAKERQEKHKSSHLPSPQFIPVRTATTPFGGKQPNPEQDKKNTPKTLLKHKRWPNLDNPRSEYTRLVKHIPVASISDNNIDIFHKLHPPSFDLTHDNPHRPTRQTAKLKRQQKECFTLASRQTKSCKSSLDYPAEKHLVQSLTRWIYSSNSPVSTSTPSIRAGIAEST